MIAGQKKKYIFPDFLVIKSAVLFTVTWHFSRELKKVMGVYYIKLHHHRSFLLKLTNVLQHSPVPHNICLLII